MVDASVATVPAAMAPRIFLRVADVFVGGVLSTLSA
jgi:hypothetical protein